MSGSWQQWRLEEIARLNGLLAEAIGNAEQEAEQARERTEAAAQALDFLGRLAKINEHGAEIAVNYEPDGSENPDLNTVLAGLGEHNGAHASPEDCARSNCPQAVTPEPGAACSADMDVHGFRCRGCQFLFSTAPERPGLSCQYCGSPFELPARASVQPAAPVTVMLPVAPGPDPAREIRFAVYEPLGITEEELDRLLPYDYVPPGACRTCHLGRAQAATGLCAYCSVLARLQAEADAAACAQVPALEPMRFRPAFPPLAVLLGVVLWVLMGLVLLGII